MLRTSPHRTRGGNRRRAPGAARPPRRKPPAPDRLAVADGDRDLFAIGAGKQVIAVDDQSNYPSSAPRTKLSGYTPNVEAIAKYKPDLVVIANDAERACARRSRKLAHPVVLQPAAARPRGRLRADRAARRRHGPRRRGEPPSIARHEDSRSRARRLGARRAPRLTVYHELEPDATTRRRRRRSSAGSTSSSGSRTSPTRPTRRLGYPKLSAEYIVAANPDLIVLADTKCCGQTAATVAARPGWSTIAAVQNGEVIVGSTTDRVALGAADRRLRAGGRERWSRSRGRGDRAAPVAVGVRAAPLRPRPRRAVAGGVLFVGAVLVGLARRARSTSASGDDRSRGARRTCRSSTCDSPLSATDTAILWQLRAPRVVLGAARRRDARARGRVVPGRLPEPARRPVPARRRRRRRARRDARDRLRPSGASGATTCCRSRRSSAARVGRRARLHARPLGRRRPRARPRSSSPASRSRRS